MIVIDYNQTLFNFKAWGRARKTQRKIISANKDEQFDQLIEDMYPNGISRVDLNDKFAYEDDQILQQLNIEN